MYRLKKVTMSVVLSLALLGAIDTTSNMYTASQQSTIIVQAATKKKHDITWALDKVGKTKWIKKNNYDLVSYGDKDKKYYYIHAGIDTKDHFVTIHMIRVNRKNGNVYLDKNYDDTYSKRLK